MSGATRLERVTTLLIAVLLPVQMMVVTARSALGPTAPADGTVHPEGAAAQRAARLPERSAAPDSGSRTPASPAPTATGGGGATDGHGRRRLARPDRP